MKLLNKTSYILVTASLFLFFISGIIFYIVLKSTIDKEIKSELNSRMHNILFKIQENPSVYGSLSIAGYARVEKVEAEDYHLPYFKDTILLEELDNSYKQYKTLNIVGEFNSGFYRIIIYKSLIESNELIERITLTVTIITALFILFIYLINQFIFGRVWSDFFVTLKKLKSFDVNTGSKVHFASSDITEFALLNSTLGNMIDKIHKDYVNLKEFTGNISHEIQTPLAIIRSKCEMLLQSVSLNKSQVALVKDISETNSRLSKLNRTLVLLTKIENKQFTHKEKITLDKIIKRHLENFSSLLQARNILLEYSMTADITLNMDPMLVDLLVVNLVKNAIMHNIENGKIIIEMDGQELKISNTGGDTDLSDKNIFERYTKFNKQSDSLGLGLSLVKKISDFSGFSVNYLYLNKLHVFSISFKSLSH